jgi:serine/threonine-protein kinase RsbT
MLTTRRHESMPIRSESDIVAVRQAVRRWAVELSFSAVEQTKIVTAASELARNTWVYGGGGTVRLESVENGIRRGLRLTFEDQGPGIPDVEQALVDGYTTGKGLGMGLSGSKRLVNEFEIDSRVGEGTRVTVTRWK